MRDPESGQYARARNTNLNEDLGKARRIPIFYFVALLHIALPTCEDSVWLHLRAWLCWPLNLDGMFFARVESAISALNPKF